MRPSGLTVYFDEAPPRPPDREYAANVTDIFLNAFVFGSIGAYGRADEDWAYPNPDEVLRLESRGQYYSLYEKMEDTDPHYYSVLDTRKNALLGKPWVVVPSDRDPRGEEIAEFVTLALKQIPRFNESLYELLDAMGKGWKACEIMWHSVLLLMNDGTTELKTLVKEIKGRPQRRFTFALDGSLRLLKPAEQFSQGMVFSTSKTGDPVPARKFIVAQFNKQNDNPYGLGLAKKCYWYYWFKKALIKYAMAFADKFGMPTVTGKYPPGLTPEKRNELLTMLRDIQQESVAIYPKDTEVELMEATRTGTVAIYKDLSDFFDDAMSKAVLGQTLTSTEGRRSGSLALGEVHADVKQDVLEKDDKWLCDILNTQLIRPIVDFNYFDVLDHPKIKFQVNKTESMEARATTYSTLKNIGMDLAKHQLRDEFKLDDPIDAEDVLPGGFGVTGEQPFGAGDNNGPKTGKQPAAGKTPPGSPEEGKDEEGKGKKQFGEDDEAHFAEGDDDPLDRILPGVIGAALNVHNPLRKNLLRLVQKNTLRGARVKVEREVERSMVALQAGTEKSLFRAFNAGRSTVRQKAGRGHRRKDGIEYYAEAIRDEQVVKLITHAARRIAAGQKKHIVKVMTVALTDAIKANETDAQFQTRLNDVFDAAGITPKNPSRIVSVYETSVATAFNAGKMTELIELLDVLPYWIYITRDDGRVRKNHLAMHYFVAPGNTAVWNRIFPPNGFRCRCTVDGMTAGEARILRGSKRVLPSGAGPDPGFNKNPLDYLRSI